MSLQTYTVHHPSNDPGTMLDKPDQLVFVKEGFCWPALFVPFLWLIYRRMWLVLVLFVAVSIAVGLLGSFLPLTPTMQTVLGLGVNLVMGLQGNDFLRWTLARRRFKEIAVVVGDGLTGAEQRFFDGLCADHGDGFPSAPAPVHAASSASLQAVLRSRSDYSILPEPGRI